MWQRVEDSRDIIYDILKSIDEYMVGLLINLH